MVDWMPYKCSGVLAIFPAGSRPAKDSMSGCSGGISRSNHLPESSGSFNDKQPVPAFFFGSKESVADRSQDRDPGGAMIRVENNAQGEGDPSQSLPIVLSVDAPGVFQQQRGAFTGHLARGFGQDHHELLATQAAGKIGGADMGAQEQADLQQHGITRRTTVSVIKFLEVVDIQHDDPQRGVIAFRPPQLALQGFLQVAAGEQAGERIAYGLLPQQGIAFDQLPGLTFDLLPIFLDQQAGQDSQGRGEEHENQDPGPVNGYQSMIEVGDQLQGKNLGCGKENAADEDRNHRKDQREIVADQKIWIEQGRSPGAQGGTGDRQPGSGRVLAALIQPEGSGKNKHSRRGQDRISPMNCECHATENQYQDEGYARKKDQRQDQPGQQALAPLFR